MYIYEDDASFVILTLYVDDLLFLSANTLLLNKLKKEQIDRFEITDMDNALRVLGMNVVRNRKKGTITIYQSNYTEDVIERFGLKDCNPAFTPGMGPQLSLNRPKETLLDDENEKRYQSITGAVLNLGPSFPLRHPICR